METEKVIQAYLAHVPELVWEKARMIKVLITDVDGVLTDGGIIYDDFGTEYKKYNVKDGLIVQHLRKSKILVGAITGRDSKVVENRCEELKFDFHYHGIKDKAKKLQEILETMEIGLEEVAYIGDDIIDLPILVQVGLAVSPSDALPYVKSAVHYVSPFAGGKGVFRELGDILLHSRGNLIPLIQNLSEKNHETK
ncbi:3-deoxy-D-manno-octulosonate 8-phosphate phosphatase (KDO 8-P phosphatase) [Algoriphagus boseongensis]|uniref:3-deoxy-D-manno-octulosonate 8-phosphate phosphatase KdsC n=1 Tax=Algoriphagus boseongensis TaxID=1442587 RepID=A0A4R6T913_9BACT|nr:HAD hydrolase family protein [Algoriphagus boseongensis]TDQ18322.1 3-deoxy-D-manno-octulosonate 8-phosphate phosphatase (KDO 8-P phosphatase) [Algoriphagus boseongensis]